MSLFISFEVNLFKAYLYFFFIKKHKIKWNYKIKIF
jgi:hypothetical protein